MIINVYRWTLCFKEVIKANVKLMVSDAFFQPFFFPPAILKNFEHVKLLPPVSGYITIKFVLIRLKMCCVYVLNPNIIMLSCTTMVGLAMSLKQVLHI